MENWLVRSGMNAQRPSNVETRTSGRCADIVARNTRFSQQSHRERTRGDRLTRVRRDRYAAVTEQLRAVDFDHSHNSRNCHGTAEDDCAKQSYYDRHVNASKLLVLPGTLNHGVEDDRLTNWGSLVQVVQLIYEDLACPICLYPPVFPRTERCGHVYCGPCVLQYISHENEFPTKKCAVCSWIIRQEDLKKVKIVHVAQLKVGCSLELLLLKRSHSTWNSYSVVPVANCRDAEFQFIQETTFDAIINELDDEIQALRVYKHDCIDEGTVELVPYISSLIVSLEEELNVFRRRAENDTYTGVSVAHQEPADSGSSAPTSRSTPNVFFYQASDGQLIFLDCLMWKCLLTDYGDVLSLPPILNVKVTGVKTYKMNQTLRKRWQHLSHVPWGRTFSMIEIELEPHVSEATLARFASALSVRLTERTRRQLEDVRLTQLKEAAENRIPTLPEGFRLSGHAELSDSKSPPDPSEFVPLCSTTNVPQKPSASFAEVTKMGARSLVNGNRIANFSRGSTGNRHLAPFDFCAELWPSLGDTAKPRKDHAAATDHSGTWRSMTSASFALKCEPPNSGDHLNDVLPNNKRRRNGRKRRSFVALDT